MKIFSLLLVFAVSNVSQADERPPWTILANYSLVETWVLSKYGVTATYNASPEVSYEVEYMRGSLGWKYFGINIGQITEQRIGVNRRSYGDRESFSWILGGYYNQLKVSIGDDLLAAVVASERGSVVLLEIRTAGVTLGLGNHWILDNGFTFGADWLTINWPLVVLSSQTDYIDATTNTSDRDKANDVVSLIKRFPSFALIKIQLGMSF